MDFACVEKLDLLQPEKGPKLMENTKHDSYYSQAAIPPWKCPPPPPSLTSPLVISCKPNN